MNSQYAIQNKMPAGSATKIMAGKAFPLLTSIILLPIACNSSWAESDKWLTCDPGFVKIKIDGKPDFDRETSEKMRTLETRTIVIRSGRFCEYDEEEETLDCNNKWISGEDQFKYEGGQPGSSNRSWKNIDRRTAQYTGYDRMVLGGHVFTYTFEGTCSEATAKPVKGNKF